MKSGDFVGAVDGTRLGLYDQLVGSEVGIAVGGLEAGWINAEGR